MLKYNGGSKVNTNPKFFNKPFVHLILIALLGIAAYSNTFGVPFQFDDFPNIVESSLARGISNICIEKSR